MDVQEGWTGTVRDVVLLAEAGVFGWLVLVLLLGLPLASSALVLRRSRLALLPLVVSLGVGGLWFTHHATGWWHVGLAFSVVPLLAVGAGWCVLLVAAGRLVAVHRAARAV